jgi:hypothetical protein
MIDSQLGQAAFRLGFFVAFVSGIMSFVTGPATAERAVSILTFLISVGFLAVVVFLVRFRPRGMGRRPLDERDGQDDVE